MKEAEAWALVSSLFTTWYSSLVRYASRLTGSVDIAEDLTQDAFLRLYRELSQSQEIRHPKAWTLCVLRHEIGRTMRAQSQNSTLHVFLEMMEDHPASRRASR